MELAIEAPGISPKDIPIRHLVELLEATSAALDAVARESGVEPPVMRLVGLHEGSAAYDLYSDAENAANVVQKFHEAIKDCGATSGASVRKALARLHAVGKDARVRVTSKVPVRGKKHSAVLYVQQLAETDELQSEMAAEYYGRVVGLQVRNGQTYVRLRYDDGGTEEFRAGPDVERKVAQFFNCTVRMYVLHMLHGSEWTESYIESIEEWSGEDFLAVMQSLRSDLSKKGISVDVEAWLQELDA